MPEFATTRIVRRPEWARWAAFILWLLIQAVGWPSAFVLIAASVLCETVAGWMEMASDWAWSKTTAAYPVAVSSASKEATHA
jgi:hypothetical protein